MATEPIVNIQREHGRILVTWDNLKNESLGEAFEAPPGYELACIQFDGPFDLSAVILEGSNDGVLWIRSSLNSLGIAGILEPDFQLRYSRPKSFTGGASAADITPVALYILRE